MARTDYHEMLHAMETISDRFEETEADYREHIAARRALRSLERRIAFEDRKMEVREAARKLKRRVPSIRLPRLPNRKERLKATIREVLREADR